MKDPDRKHRRIKKAVQLSGALCTLIGSFDMGLCYILLRTTAAFGTIWHGLFFSGMACIVSGFWLMVYPWEEKKVIGSY